MNTFRLRDPLYGLVELPSWLLGVIRAAEVQRLRDVRLMNTSSDQLSALSDIRRFTHTMGAVHLVDRWLKRPTVSERVSAEDRRTLLVATVLHDVATPPFGHTVEYLLTVTANWTHEDYLKYIVLGTYHTESKYHEVYFRERLALWDALPAAGVDPGAVCNLVLGRAALGPIIAGAMDADNVDTAYRMAQALGQAAPQIGPERVMDVIQLDHSGRPHIDLRSVSAVSEWMATRRAAYECFMFDPSYLLSQSLLSAACRLALSEGQLGFSDWFLTDEMLLRRLVEFGPTRELARRFALSHLPHPLFVGWYTGQPRDGDLRHPEALARVEDAMRAEFDRSVVVHVIRDAGAFDKGVSLRGSAGEAVPAGVRSDSTIVVVSSLLKPKSTRTAVRAAAVLEAFGLRQDDLRPMPVPADRMFDGEQLSLLGSTWGN